MKQISRFSPVGLLLLLSVAAFPAGNKSEATLSNTPETSVLLKTPAPTIESVQLNAFRESQLKQEIKEAVEQPISEIALAPILIEHDAQRRTAYWQRKLVGLETSRRGFDSTYLEN